jgi:Xaa-Pro aminopeptidase
MSVRGIDESGNRRHRSSSGDFMATATRDLSFFARRRRRFLKRLGDGVAFLPAAPARTRSNDVQYPYRQDSDFYYLTGFREPEAVAVLKGSSNRSRFTLFVRPRDRDQEIWNGTRAGVEGARELYGADEAYEIGDFEKKLPELIEGAAHVHLSIGKYPEFDAKLTRVLEHQRWQSRRGTQVPAGMVDVREILHEMRLIKHAEDLKSLREASRISCEAHQAAMRACRPGMREYELAALIEYVFKRNGAASPGYPSIVGSGPNATILHYTDNERAMADGDLVLIDAGAEYEYFSADITRTFPVNGRFSTPQQEIYDLVLGAQKAAIRAVQPGGSVRRVHDVAVRHTVRGLRGLGFLKGDMAQLIKDGAYKAFFMHGTSHWLGMDVHDVGRYRNGKAWRDLEPGMVLTVEPGIYIAPHTKRVPRRYWGIGIRIEDDVLVTARGHEVLTAAVPKEPAAIEQLMDEPLRMQV